VPHPLENASPAKSRGRQQCCDCTELPGKPVVPGKLLIIAIHGGTVLNGRETSERGPLVTNLVIMSLLSPFPRGVVRD
jgi:hypothetical protein